MCSRDVIAPQFSPGTCLLLLSGSPLCRASGFSVEARAFERYVCGGERRADVQPALHL